MSISPIAGVGHAAPTTPRPEAAEVPGAADHDGDGDDAAGRAAARPASVAPPVPGRVDTKA